MSWRLRRPSVGPEGPRHDWRGPGSSGTSFQAPRHGPGCWEGHLAGGFRQGPGHGGSPADCPSKALVELVRGEPEFTPGPGAGIIVAQGFVIGSRLGCRRGDFFWGQVAPNARSRAAHGGFLSAQTGGRAPDLRPGRWLCCPNAVAEGWRCWWLGKCGPDDTSGEELLTKLLRLCRQPQARLSICRRSVALGVRSEPRSLGALFAARRRRRPARNRIAGAPRQGRVGAVQS